MTCACGKPVHIKKTGECSSCYQHRYYEERKPMPRVLASPEQVAKVESDIFNALVERERMINAARTALFRAEHPDKIRADKAAYRQTHRSLIRERDRAYKLRRKAASIKGERND